MPCLPSSRSLPMRRHDLQSADGVMLSKTPEGRCFVSARGVPTASVAGHAPGCIYQDTANGTLYENTGTSTSATWSPLAALTGGGARVARGIVTLSATNPTAVATGLTTITS